MTRDKKLAKFEFTFNKDICIKQFNNCIYCKHKDIEIKKLKEKNEKMKNEIIAKDIKITELESYINDFIDFSQKYNINNIDELKMFINDRSNYINDDLLYIDYDVFQYESNFLLSRQLEEYEEQINDYEEQLDIINETLKNNNINSFSKFKTILSESNLNLSKKYDNIFTILDKVDENVKSNNIIINKLINNYNDLDIRIKNLKKKLSKIKEGDIITTKGIKRKALYINGNLRLYKIENVINKIKMFEEEINSYCNDQIKWARNIIGDDYSDIQIIKLLDILNKLNGDNNTNYSSSDTNSDNEIYKKYNNILNENKKAKVLELESYSKLGKQFIDDKINSKKDIPKELLEIIKEAIKSSDINYGKKDEKINRFVNQCKRYYILSQKIKSPDNIIRSKCKTHIRDMNNNDFDNLLKLLDNKN